MHCVFVKPVKPAGLFTGASCVSVRVSGFIFFLRWKKKKPFFIVIHAIYFNDLKLELRVGVEENTD